MSDPNTVTVQWFFFHNNVYHYFTGTRCPREEKYGTKTESWTSNKIAQQHVTERDETVERKAWYHSMIEIVWHSMWNKKSVTTPANHRTNNIDWRCLGQIYYFKRLNLAVNSKVEAKRFQEKKTIMRHNILHEILMNRMQILIIIIVCNEV